MKKSESKHREIFDILRHEILTGKYDERGQFPSELSLARRFGVSRPTVTRALIGLKTSGLLVGRSGSGTFLGANAGFIGAIIPDRDWNSFFAAVTSELERTADRLGYTILKDDCSAKDPDVRAEQMRLLAHEFTTRRVRGVIVEPFDASENSDAATRRILGELEKARIPVVLLDRDTTPYPARSAYDLVGVDNVQAGYRLARHFLDLGARRPAFLTIPCSASATQERVIGFAQAVVDAGREWSADRVLDFAATDRAALRRLFASRRAPDAIGCRNDHVAAFLLQSLAALRIRVPRDVLVGGFDDCNLAPMLAPPLTSVRQPAAEIARTAFQTLIWRIEHPEMPPQKILLDTTITIRKSTQRNSRKRPG